MAMVVKNNMSAISTLNTLNKNQSALKSSLEKVSSGMKINSAQDDASGYAISERMRAMIRSLDQANENTQNGNSLMKVAEGAVSKTVEIIDTLKKKAIAAATDTKTDDDRATIQKEIDQLIDQIDENALVTYNGKYLLDGSRTLAGTATYTAMTNQKLDVSTDGGTKLVDLKNRKGESLEIIATDQVTASYVKNGRTYTTTFDVGNNRLEDIFYNLNELGDSPAFGPANLKEKQMSLSDAKLKIQTDTGNVTANSKAIIDILNGEQTDTSVIDKYVAAAATMVREGYIAPGKNVDGISTIGTAGQDLESALEAYFDKFSLITSRAAGTQQITGSVTLGFNIFQADGSVEASTYTFNATGLTNSSQTLKDIDSDVFDKMISDLTESVYNLSKAGSYNTDTDITSASDNSDTNAAAALVYGSGTIDYSTIGGIKDSLTGAAGNLGTAIQTALKMYVTDMDATIDGKRVNGDGQTASAAVSIKLQQAITSATAADVSNAAVAFAAGTAASGGTAGTPGAVTAYTSYDGTANPAVNQVITSVAAAAGIEYESIKTGEEDEAFDNNLKAITNYATSFLASRLANPVYSGVDIGLDPSKAMVKTADGTIGLTVTAMNDSIGGQISGLTIKIMDAQSQSRTAINEVLDAFGTTIFASSKSDDNTLKFHTGAEAGQALSVGLSDMRSTALGLKGNDSVKVSVATQAQANAALSVFNNALQKALDVQTTIGAIEARLNYTSDNLTTATENITASESTIRDADLAKEMTEYTKNNVLLQAAQSMLAQANQNSSAVLSLLQ